MEYDPKRSGAAIRVLRRLRGLTISELSRLSHLSDSGIWKAEMARGKLSLDSVEKLARALGVPQPVLLFPPMVLTPPIVPVSDSDPAMVRAREWLVGLCGGAAA